MPKDVYYHFPQTLEQARRVGARGGKATARNRRAQWPDLLTLESAEPEDEAPPRQSETTAAAIASLDSQYPWLRAAEQRCCQRARRP